MKENYLSWNVNPDDFYDLKTQDEKLRFLLNFAVLAPSSHNSQPWSFVATEQSVDIYVNSSRLLTVSDKNRRQLYISLGCALENLLVAADYYDIHGDVKYAKPLFGDGYFCNPAVEVDLNLDKDKKEYWADAGHLIFSIPERRTNRNKYDAQMPFEVNFLPFMQRLSQLDVMYDFVSDKIRKENIANVVLNAMSEAMADKNFRLELAEYVKSNYTSSGIGMPGFGMGIPGPVSLLLPFIIRHFDMYKVTRKQDESLLKDGTPMFGILSTREDNPESWIKAGQAYQRIALECERAGIKTAVMAAAIQIGDYYKQLQEIIGTSARPQLFFRIGYCNKEVHPSPRLSSAQVEG